MNAPSLLNTVSTLDFRLLNEFQRDFPLTAQPWQHLADSLGCDEGEVLTRLTLLQRQGAISRIGAVITPGTFGVSTLAALAVPWSRLDQVAEYINTLREVNHNYAREHHYNLWFVLNARTPEHLEAVLAQIATDTGCTPLNLPLMQPYHIDLGFRLDNLTAAQPRRTLPPNACLTPPAQRLLLNSVDNALLAALEPGLALVPRPFATLGAQADLSEDEVLTRLRAWQVQGALKRFGVVVRHHELGYRANAMCVWQVAEDEIDALGQRLAQCRGVNLCYRRRSHQPHWGYNLFCMIHGQSREQVLSLHQRAAEHTGLDQHPGHVLFSTRRYKQRGARYAR